MKIIKIDLENPDQEIIKKAINVLRGGGIVVYPTDTAYGLGANALDEKAVKKVYEIKVRNFSKPTHVIVRNWAMIDNLTFINKFAKNIFDSFMPGPITLILKKKSVVPDILTSGLSTLGVRIPNCEVTKQLSLLANIPYTTPSANKSGEKPPYSVKDVKGSLDIQKVDLILDAGQLPITPASTIIELSTPTPEILREGPIKKAELEKVLGKILKT